MTLAAVQGQERAISMLRSALSSQTVPHAYLFAGPEGVGKELAAVGLAQALMCPEKPAEGCGTCGTCGRIARRNHPDVTWLMPEEQAVSRGLAGKSDFTGTPSRDIKVEQVRALQERLSFRALEGTRKIAIVAHADQMNEKAQNAFLKTLEEPPPGTVLMLIAGAPEKLLPTLRSRCSRLQFGPLPDALITSRVAAERKLDPPTAALVAAMSGGSLGKALSLDVKGLAARREVIELFERARQGEVRGLLSLGERWGRSREDAEEALQILAVWLRDVAVQKAGGLKLINADLQPLAEEAAGAVSELALHRAFKLLDEAQTQMAQRNASPRLQLERFLILAGAR